MIVFMIIVLSLASIVGEELGLAVANFFISGEYLNWLVLFFAVPYFGILFWIEERRENKQKQ